jgi:hypothetical protein
MTLESNKTLVRRWLKMGEGGFAGDFHEYFTPDYRGHLAGQPTQSLDDLFRIASLRPRESQSPSPVLSPSALTTASGSRTARLFPHLATRMAHLRTNERLS